MSFKTACEGLARCLPGEWTADHRYDSWTVLKRADGFGLSCHSTGLRISVSPEFPKMPGNTCPDAKWFGLNMETPKMTFALGRVEGKPVRVAVELHRRLIEPWEPKHRQCLAFRDERMKERADADDVANRLVEILAGRLIDGPILEGRQAHVRFSKFDMRGDFRVNPWGTIDITLNSLPGWAALKIAEAIAGLPKPNEP